MARLKPDVWLRAKAFYEAGHSHREVATKFGVSHKAVQNKIRIEGWVQNLEDRIKSKVAELQVMEAVKVAKAAKVAKTPKVAGGRGKSPPAKVAGDGEKETTDAINTEAARRVRIAEFHVKLAQQAILMQQTAIGRIDTVDGKAKFVPNWNLQKSAKINAETITLLINLERRIHKLEDSAPTAAAQALKTITIVNAEDEVL